MGKDWRKEFDDILREKSAHGEDGAPIPGDVEIEPVPEPVAQEKVEVEEGAGEGLDDSAPPVVLEPGSSLDELSVEVAVPDTLMRTGFSKVVEHMFHELVNQLGQVREIARRRIEDEALQQDQEERRVLKEEEDSFFRAVEKMFRDIRENFAERLRRLTEEERQTAAALEETKQELEQRQQELSSAHSELEGAKARIGELGRQIEQLRSEMEGKPDEEYVAELEKRLDEAYALLRAIEETYLAMEGGAVA